MRAICICTGLTETKEVKVKIYETTIKKDASAEDLTRKEFCYETEAWGRREVRPMWTRIITVEEIKKTKVALVTWKERNKLSGYEENRVGMLKETKAKRGEFKKGFRLVLDNKKMVKMVGEIEGIGVIRFIVE